ncbi:MAG: M14 family zinc carboxypeptidase [candidate division WOR-3 bacterium]
MNRTLLVMLAFVAFAAALSTAPRQLIVRVQARSYEELRRHLDFKGTSITIAGADIGTSYDLMLDEQDLDRVLACGLANTVVVPDIDRAAEQAMLDGYYQSYDSLVRVMRWFCTNYSSICRLESIGTTHENRWIYGVKLSDYPGVDEDEPEVLLVGLHHAREWATPQVCRHILDTLARNYSSNTAFRNYIDTHETWIFPVINVDGYVYDYPAQRSWRKDRQPFGSSYGCDPNRDYNGCCNGNRMGDWGSLVPGSVTSHLPSNETFFGGSGGWGREIYHLSEFFKQRTFVAVISYHSYSELVLWPYGHGERTPDSVYMRTLGQGMAAQIQRLSGGYYTPQQSNYLYPTNCGSDDWMYGWAHYIGGFPCMSYTVEVGTAFYQNTSQLDHIQTQNFKGAWYLMLRSDSIISALEGRVPRPILAPMDTVGPNFTLHWTPTRPEHNHPDRWELEELTGLSIVLDSFESGFTRWDTMGAVLSTAQRRSGNYSFQLRNGNNVSNYIVTKDPYPVQAGDSLRYWIWYNTETNYDVVTTEVSLEGKEWVQLHDRFTGNSNGWVRRAYSLSPWVGKSVFIRFRYMTDDNTLGTGVYIDDVWPVPSFSGRTTISSNITDTMYSFTGKAAGTYFYRARGRNVAWGWNDKGPLEDVIVVAPVRDVGATVVVAPTGAIDSGASVTPACTVYNYGTSTESYNVRCKVGGFYNHTAAVTNHAPGVKLYVTFPAYSTWPRGTFSVTCSTELGTDVTPANDKASGSVTVRVLDAQTLSIIAPTGTVDSGATIAPQANVRNNGTTPATFNVRFDVQGGYSNTQTVTNLASGASTTVTFSNWTAGPRGTLVTRCTTMLTGDMVPVNNLATGNVTVRVRDVACQRLLAPSGTVDSGMTVTPTCSVANPGSTTESYQVRMKVGNFYNETATVSGHAPGTTIRVTFPDWAVTQLGTHMVSCSTELTGDLVQANNRQSGSVTVLRPPQHDVGCTQVIAPLGQVDSGTSVIPACTVYNYGNMPESYTVRMKVGSGYDQPASVVNHAPGTRLYVTFPAWTAGARGTYAVSCSTELAIDSRPNNDRATGQVEVRVLDVELSTIIAPAGTIIAGTVVTPQVRLRNSGSVPVLFPVRLVITGTTVVFDTTETDVALNPGETRDHSFTRSWTAGPAGNYTTLAWTALGGDLVPANDSARTAFTVSAGNAPGWLEKTSIPLLPSSKQVKDGGWLACAGSYIYAAKGNKTQDFYRYDIERDSWTTLASIPDGREGRKPGKGAVGAAGGNYVYAVKGNNTQGFWRYSPSQDSWHQMADIPLGMSSKKVKGGTDMAYVDGNPDHVYLLKGHRNEFWRYDPAADTWSSLPAAPAQKWDKGSWLVHNAGLLYAHQAKYHGLYAYDPDAGAWGKALTGMPFIGASGKKKKSKDGGSAAVLDRYIYALKGGNTQEFWRYDPELDSWTELEPMPLLGSSGRSKKVKAGADIVGTHDCLFALKGNKTLEFWRYTPTTTPCASRSTLYAEEDIQADMMPDASGVMRILPNPLHLGFATIHLNPRIRDASNPVLSLFDISGRLVYHSSLITHRSAIPLDLRNLRSGVYLARIEIGRQVYTHRLLLAQ